MSIIGLILVLVLVGVALAYIPMDGRLKMLVVVVLVFVTVGWLMSYFDLWGYLQPGHGRHWRR